MNPNLMGSSGVEFACNQLFALIMAGEKFSKFGFGIFTCLTDRHFKTIMGTPSDRAVDDGDLIFHRRSYNREIKATHGFVLKLEGESLVRFVVFCDHHCAAGSPVEAVDDPVALFTAEG